MSTIQFKIMKTISSKISLYFPIGYCSANFCFKMVINSVTLSILLGYSHFVMAASQAILGDRVIVAINDKIYTQRQLEMYFVVRQSLQENRMNYNELISQVNWMESLRFFVEEMVLMQEFDRVGGTVVAQDQWQKLSERSAAQFSKSQSLKAIAARLEMNQTIKDSILTSILRAEGIKNFKRQTSQSKNQDDQNKSHQSNAWMNEIFSRTTIRHYKDAEVYRPIGKGK